MRIPPEWPPGAAWCRGSARAAARAPQPAEWRPSARSCRDGAGCCTTSRTGPISTMRPAYMTATRSAVSAITPMSWVISITAVPRSRHSRFRSAMICAWMETSSAVVGSSAISSVGLRTQRQRQHHALAHAARELVRVAVDARPRALDAGLLQQRDRPLPRRALRNVGVRADRFDDLVADAIERVEAGERVLEHHADAPAAHLAHLLGGQLVDALGRSAAPRRR